MNTYKQSAILILYIFLGFSIAQKSDAVTTPTFPACTNPQGTVKANYTSGTHGVVGSSFEYKGNDTVYQLTSETLSQCLCTEEGDGTQTNWWKVSSLTDSDIQILKNEGWHFVPNGSLWGLENAAYMARNSEYECKDNKTESVLASATSVLGLATTGNMRIILSTALLGLVLLALGLIFHFYPAQNTSLRFLARVWKKTSSVLNNILSIIRSSIGIESEEQRGLSN